MGQFIYAPINPIKLTQIVDFDTRYNSLPFDFQQNAGGLEAYAQKYETGDTVKLQMLSDFIPTLNVKDLATSRTVSSISYTTPSNSIVGQTYTLYEFEIDWATIGIGTYYLELFYTDSGTQTWQSEAISVALKWPDTILFEYNNSENQFTVLFNTGIVFNLRVEGTIAEYTPEFDDVIYNDQLKNTTKLNAVPYRTFNLYVANARGIPQWMADKVNWVFGCDQIKIDGVYYQNTSGAKWEVNRNEPDGPKLIGLKLPIIEVDNKFLQSLTSESNAPEGFTVVELVKNNLAKTADFSITGIFKKNSLLKNIVVYNNGANFTLSVGTTPGGNDIGQWNVDSDRTAIDRKYLFPASGSTTVYVSGLTAAGTANADILFDYLQFDQTSTPPGSDTVPSFFPKNFKGEWIAINPTDFTRDWDLATGLGKVDTDYYGCAICDGRNGTPDLGGKVSIGYVWDTTNPNWELGYDALGTVVGVSSIRQTLAQLAPHSHPIRSTNSRASSSTGVDVVRGSLEGSEDTVRGGGGAPGEFGPGGDGINDVQTIGIAGGNLDGTGLGAPMENRQPSVVMLFFMKIM
jgi:microcystin-dependent protein